MVKFSFELEDVDAQNVAEIIRAQIANWRWQSAQSPKAESDWYNAAADRMEAVLEVMMRGTSKV